MDKLADAPNESEQDAVLEHFYDYLPLQKTAYLSEGSLFVRSYTTPMLSKAFRIR